MEINMLEMEWTDTGCKASARGFEGVLLTCPRCQELLPRDGEHRCGDAVISTKKSNKLRVSMPKKQARKK